MIAKLLQKWKGIDSSPAVVCDLDKMIAETLGFRFNGRVHRLRPIELDEFMKATEAMAKAEKLLKSKKVTQAEIMTVYAELISSVCDTIKIKDLNKMTVSQVGALVQLVMDTVTGRAQAGDEKKKVKQATKASKYA